MSPRSALKRSIIGAVAAASIVTAGGVLATISASAAANPTTVAAASSSSTVIAGRLATLTITLRSDVTGTIIPGVQVKLWSRQNSTSAWAFVGSATTNSAGVASISVKPYHNTQYEWTFAGNSQFQPVTSSVVTVWVAPAISITANHPTATTLNIWGKVTPDQTGKIVVLLELISGSWHNIGSTYIKSQRMPNGTTMVGYLIPLHSLTGHSYVFRATRTATSTNVAGVSATLTVKF